MLGQGEPGGRPTGGDSSNPCTRTAAEAPWVSPRTSGVPTLLCYRESQPPAQPHTQSCLSSQRTPNAGTVWGPSARPDLLEKPTVFILNNQLPPGFRVWELELKRVEEKPQECGGWGKGPVLFD